MYGSRRQSARWPKLPSVDACVPYTRSLKRVVVQLRRSDPNNGATSGMLIVSRPPSWKSGEDNDESRHARIPETRTVRIWIKRDRVELVGQFDFTERTTNEISALRQSRWKENFQRARFPSWKGKSLFLFLEKDKFEITFEFIDLQ